MYMYVHVPNLSSLQHLKHHLIRYAPYVEPGAHEGRRPEGASNYA